MTSTGTESIAYVRGDATGLSIPAHGEALLAAGPDFLTKAFRTFGTLSADNRVTRITKWEVCPGGSTGKKFFLSVEYERMDPGLFTELFVKFSRDFTDERRDFVRREMEPEASFAAISRLPGFPISVPAAFFADYHHQSGTGVIVTERIAFGRGNIEPHHPKTLDYYLDDPLAYYRAIVTALARLAGAYKAGRLAPDVDERFPWDPEHSGCDPILYSEEGLNAELARCVDFAARCPQLLPAEVCTPEFFAKMKHDAFRIREHEQTIQHFLRGNHDLIALCHWNSHIDNAWFWRDPAGGLHCGLIDWGRVSQITMGAALWGCLSAAHHDIWKYHLDELLELFVGEYHEHGGPLISAAELELHLMLNIASMGVARVLAFPEIILFRMPQAPTTSGPRDTLFLHNEPARNCLHVYTVFLNLWRRRDFAKYLDRLLQRVREHEA